MASRWFVVPVVTESTTEGKIRKPKYGDQVSQWAGQALTVDSDEIYVIKFIDNTSVLDSIESNSDAYTRQEQDISKSDVVSHLNKVTGQSRSYQEWTERFGT